MKLEGKNIGFAITGSFRTFENILKELENLKKEKANIIPIRSFNAANMDTRFAVAKELKDKVVLR